MNKTFICCGRNHSFRQRLTFFSLLGALRSKKNQQIICIETDSSGKTLSLITQCGLLPWENCFFADFAIDQLYAMSTLKDLFSAYPKAIFLINADIKAIRSFLFNAQKFYELLQKKQRQVLALWHLKTENNTIRTLFAWHQTFRLFTDIFLVQNTAEIDFSLNSLTRLLQKPVLNGVLSLDPPSFDLLKAASLAKKNPGLLPHYFQSVYKNFKPVLN